MGATIETTAEGMTAERVGAMLTMPVVHLNGTSREALLEGIIDSVVALRHAIDVLQKNAPNARDYYTISPTAFSVAMAEHTRRVVAMQTVLEELQKIGNRLIGAEG